MLGLGGILSSKRRFSAIVQVQMHSVAAQCMENSIYSMKYGERIFMASTILGMNSYFLYNTVASQFSTSSRGVKEWTSLHVLKV